MKTMRWMALLVLLIGAVADLKAAEIIQPSRTRSINSTALFAATAAFGGSLVGMVSSTALADRWVWTAGVGGSGLVWIDLLVGTIRESRYTVSRGITVCATGALTGLSMFIYALTRSAAVPGI